MSKRYGEETKMLALRVPKSQYFRLHQLLSNELESLAVKHELKTLKQKSNVITRIKEHNNCCGT